MSQEHGSSSSLYEEMSVGIGATLQEFYDSIAQQPLPPRFGKALGAVFVATTNLAAFGSTRPEGPGSSSPVCETNCVVKMH
jgi:hypothetical protein